MKTLVGPRYLGGILAWNVGILRPLSSGVVADAVTDGTLVLREVVEPSAQIFALLNPWVSRTPKIFRMTRGGSGSIAMGWTRVMIYMDLTII